jgi:hypothetical protein
MDIAWFRDLSITIMGFIASAVLIFAAILAYRLYHIIRLTLLKVREVSQKASDTITIVQEGIKPLLQITSIIQFVIEAIKSIGKMFKKESSEGGNING